MNKQDYLTLNEAKNIINKLPKYYKIIGSISRNEPIVNDLDILIINKSSSHIKKYLQKKFPKIWKKSNGRNDRFDYFPIINNKKVQMNFWFTNKENEPFYLLAYSYPKNFSIALRRIATRKGFKLSQYGLFKNNEKLPIKTIKQVFKLLKLKYRTPQEEYLKHIK